MTANAYVQFALYFVVLLLLAWPLGRYMARIYSGDYPIWMRWLRPVERVLYRLSGIKPEVEMNWLQYTFAVLIFNVLGLALLYVLLRTQGMLPLNPAALPNLTPELAFNTAVSFISNTNWQAYSGESTLSYLSQMLGLTVQNFLSAATGMAVLLVLIRGFVRRETKALGNFWVDMTRSTLYILLPLSLLLATALVSQGVVQTFNQYETATTLEPVSATVKTQTIALGPVASQVAIKQLGTNGGGFFGVNSAHPFENPTPLSDFLEMLSILLIPAALCITFGQMLGDRRQGYALLAAMTLVAVVFAWGCVAAEQSGNPLYAHLGVSAQASSLSPGGNMEGKELRFGIVNSGLWATVTTAASNGSVNAMHDSFTPLGGLVPLWMMMLGEVIFGGVGSGLYGMLVFAILAVFVAGLMIGRTPEYLGKKIGAFDMKMAALVILIPPFMILVGTAIAVVTPVALASLSNPGAHGFTQILYAFTSAGNNNGSAFAGLSVNTPFYNNMLSVAMLLSRFWLIIPILALAGSLAAKKSIPVSVGTLPTHTPLFVFLLIATVVIVGALTFLPALALGPVVEHLQMLAAQ